MKHSHDFARIGRCDSALVGLCIEDDSRKVIGDPEFVEEVAAEASVRVEAWAR